MTAATLTQTDLIERAREFSAWSDFAGSLVAAFRKYGKLSEKQEGALRSMVAKVDAGRAAKQANSGEVNVSAIEKLFADVVATGHKKPKFRAIGLEISLASSRSINAGALYVKDEGGNYLGKVQRGRFFASTAAKPGTLHTLERIAVNPRQEAVEYGKKYGICGCCGRELSDPVSVAMGIGPVCAERWGL